MTINIRQKGANGEREIAKKLNAIVDNVRIEAGLNVTEINDEPFQRNQNQSAVGGDDLTNPFGLSIEIKRQEALSINSWWKQTVKSADRTGGIPILLFKQNHKKWRCVMRSSIRISTSTWLTTKSEIDIDTFYNWFSLYYARWLHDDNNN